MEREESLRSPTHLTESAHCHFGSGLDQFEAHCRLEDYGSSAAEAVQQCQALIIYLLGRSVVGGWFMARRPRVHFPGALYHVISRGNQRQVIYRDDQDHRRFQTLLSDVVKRHSITLYAYVLMPNHFHLLLEVSRAPLAKVMQSLLYRYTRHYNQRHRKVGHLFQGRYRAILCDRDNYLMELIRYLHLNPVRAGMIRDPSRYRWSSHRDYLRGKSEAGVAIERGLAVWGARRSRSMLAYRQFIRDGLSEEHRQEYYEVKEQRYLGDEDFVEVIQQSIDEVDARTVVTIAISDIIQEIAREAGVSEKVLLTKGRGRMGSRLRAEAVYVAREVGGISLTAAAKHLRRDLSTISLGVKRLEEELGSDRHQRDRLESVCSRLRRGRRRKYPITKA